MFDLIIMYVLMAGFFTFGKQALLNSSPFFLTAVRYIPSGLIFLGIAYFVNKKEFVYKRSCTLLFFGISLFYFLMDALRFVCLRHVPSSHAALISALSPFVAAGIAYFFFKESFHAKKIAALFLGFFGVLPLIAKSISQTKIDTSLFDLTGCYVAMFLSVVFAVVATFIFKKLIAHYSILLILGATLFFGGVMSLITSLCLETWSPVPVENLAVVVPIIFFLFVTHNLIAQPLYGYLVRKYPVTLITFATLVTPITSAALGYFIYNQSIGLTFAFSTVTLLIAFVIFYHEELKEGLIR